MKPSAVEINTHGMEPCHNTLLVVTTPTALRAWHSASFWRSVLEDVQIQTRHALMCHLDT